MVVAVPLSYVLPPGSDGRATLQLLLGALLAVFVLWLLALRLRAGRRLSPAGVDAAAAVVLAGLPYAVLYDLPFVAPALLRLGVRPTWHGRTLLAAWWVLSLVAVALLRVGVDGAAALLPPALAAATVAAGRPLAGGPGAGGRGSGDATRKLGLPRPPATARASEGYPLQSTDPPVGSQDVDAGGWR
jgi:hypothetical protein